MPIELDLQLWVSGKLSGLERTREVLRGSGGNCVTEGPSLR